MQTQYIYEVEKPKLFTDKGQVMFLEIRDRVNSLLEQAGAVRLENAIAGTSGDTWQMLACIDRMIELDELRELTAPGVYAQRRVFVKGIRG